MYSAQALIYLLGASSSLLSLTAALPTVTSPCDSLARRQSGDISINGTNDGGSLSSDLPISCITGCLDPLQAYFGCTSGENSTLCETLCERTIYDNFVACYDCLLSNGAQDVTLSDAQQKLDDVNVRCAPTSNTSSGSNATSHFSEVPKFTATATTTGPFTFTWSGPNATLPTWTGLETFIATESGGAGAGSGTTEIITISTSKASISASATSLTGSNRATSASSAVAAASSTGAALSCRSVNGYLGLGGFAGVVGYLLV